jgi:hypothetical protein
MSTSTTATRLVASKASLACERSETTLGTWLAQGRSAPTGVALHFIAHLGDELTAAHRQGVKHGALSVEAVVLPAGDADALGLPRLHGFAPSRGPSLRREQIADDITGLAGIAQALLAPAPTEDRPRHQSTPGNAVRAVLEAGLDRREGVFLFDSPEDFAASLSSAVASDHAAAAAANDPALAGARRQQRRRRTMRVLAGTAVACLALLAVSAAAATRIRSGEGAAADHAVAVSRP